MKGNKPATGIGDPKEGPKVLECHSHPVLIAGIPHLPRRVMKYHWMGNNPALTISFAHIVGGQHALDEFFWRGQSSVTLTREGQNAGKKERREVYLDDQRDPIFVFRYRNLRMRILRTYD